MLCRLMVLGTFGLMLMSFVGAAQAADTEEAVPFVTKSGERRVTAEERPFGFLSDPSGPSAGVTSFAYQLGLASGIAADRPLPVTLGSPGMSNAFELGHGITDQVSAFATAVATESNGAVLRTGLKVLLTDPHASFRVSVAGLGLYETGPGVGGAALQLAVAQDLGRLRLGTSVLAEKVLSQTNDEIDAIAMLGASYRVLPAVRLGAEYVAQDLEELTSPGAEGGARQAVGPTVAVDLGGGLYQLVASAAFGITPISPRALARLALATSF
jgi:hypothetical protein